MPKRLPRKPSQAFVMIRTFFSRAQHAARRAEGPVRSRMAAQEGDTLIEVIISVALISMVVIAVLFGLNSTNRVTSASRARSQADVLAQEDEEQLRSEPVRRLDEIERTKEVKLGATTYTIKTTSKYIADATSTASCTSSVAKADYLKTISTVTWPSGPTGGVIETGVISPPADSALIVQVEESGTPLPGATVDAIGPAPSASKYELETSANGCAVLALSPGEYTINVNKTGYVDPNGYANTDADSSTTQSVYLPAETTLKEGYNLGRGGNVKVKFSNPGEPLVTQEGDSFVIYNTGMSSYRTFPEPATVGTYKPTIESPTTVFPFTTNYTVYAGTCEANLPTRNGQSANPEVLVPPGKLGEQTVSLASINVKVLESKALEKPVSKAVVTLEDTGCNTVRKLETTSTGTLTHPGMPFGTYTLCVSASVSAKTRRYSQTGIANNNANGTAVQTVYMNEAPESAAGCP